MFKKNYLHERSDITFKEDHIQFKALEFATPDQENIVLNALARSEELIIKLK